MNIIPWKKRSGTPHMRGDFDDLMTRFMEPFHFGLSDITNRLPETFTSKRVPAMNIAETEKTFTVTLELPGMDEEDIDIELMGNQLQISGERKWEEEQEGKEFHRVESQFGKFQRTLTLPDNLRLDGAEVEATFTKGILEIVIPKVEPTPVAKIRIRNP